MARIAFAFPQSWDETTPQFKIAVRAAAERLGHDALDAHSATACRDAAVSFIDITEFTAVQIANAMQTLGGAIVLLENANRCGAGEHARSAKRSARAAAPETPVLQKLTYRSSSELADIATAAILTHLPEDTVKCSLPDKIRHILDRRGPINLSGLAAASRTAMDDIRPILVAMLAKNEVSRIGAGLTARYQVAA